MSREEKLAKKRSPSVLKTNAATDVAGNAPTLSPLQPYVRGNIDAVTTLSRRC